LIERGVSRENVDLVFGLVHVFNGDEESVKKGVKELWKTDESSAFLHLANVLSEVTVNFTNEFEGDIRDKIKGFYNTVKESSSDHNYLSFMYAADLYEC